MRVSQWAEIRRLAEVEGLSQRQIAQRLHCCWKTVKKALSMPHPPDETRRSTRGSILDPYKPKIDALIAKYSELSAVRVLEEIRKGPDGYPGEISLVRKYLRQIRPARGRVYQEVFYEPGQAMQVDWGTCGQVKIGTTTRTVSVFVAVLCYSRLGYIEFCLSQRKAEFYRALDRLLDALPDRWPKKELDSRWGIVPLRFPVSPARLGQSRGNEYAVFGRCGVELPVAGRGVFCAEGP